jgi:hypothetical protein
LKRHLKKIVIFRSKAKHVGDLLEMFGAHQHNANTHNANNGGNAAPKLAPNAPFLPGVSAIKTYPSSSLAKPTE